MVQYIQTISGVHISQVFSKDVSLSLSLFFLLLIKPSNFPPKFMSQSTMLFLRISNRHAITSDWVAMIQIL